MLNKSKIRKEVGAKIDEKIKECFSKDGDTSLAMIAVLVNEIIELNVKVAGLQDETTSLLE